MTSAFGIDHGYISKSYKKMAPKLARAGNFTAKDTDDIGQRMKVNYSQWRMKSGVRGRDVRNMKRTLASGRADDLQRMTLPEWIEDSKTSGKKLKEASRIATSGYSAQARRKRVLP